jgi:hypothetical protein
MTILASLVLLRGASPFSPGGFSGCNGMKMRQPNQFLIAKFIVKCLLVNGEEACAGLDLLALRV